MAFAVLRYDKAANSITFTPEQAAEYSAALADLLCWIRGYKAAGGPDADFLELEPIREINIALKALNWKLGE